MSLWRTKLPEPISSFLEQVIVWAERFPDIDAIVLVGSYARGEARESSDVDLVIMASSPAELIENVRWVDNFGTPVRIALEDWGKVQSIRVFYNHGLEIEFGITSRNWLTPPVDQGTLKVIKDGIQVIYKKEGYSTLKLYDELNPGQAHKWEEK